MIVVVRGAGFIGRNLLVKLHASGATMTTSRNRGSDSLAAHARSIAAFIKDALHDALETVLPRYLAVNWLGGGRAGAE